MDSRTRTAAVEPNVNEQPASACLCEVGIPHPLSARATSHPMEWECASKGREDMLGRGSSTCNLEVWDLGSVVEAESQKCDVLKKEVEPMKIRKLQCVLVTTLKDVVKT
ncbi:unnamed protein product [Lupinus luteus]|uniref:Uncharacterized protein n=1 Tax=Lupinus luteus TaxID=3873 RepID=A0AAV1XKY2_LUPLU